MHEELIAPRAAALTESMRDLGYSLETALADILDNSITAGAKNIDVFVEASDADPIVAIVDDGSGMSLGELRTAMRPGSRSPLEDRHPDDLGRFGLGLKTASFALCRRLTVVTRKNGRTHAACWDLDHVAEHDDWLLQFLEKTEIESLAFVDRLGSQGTMVLWSKLDRFTDPTSGSAFKDHLYEQVDRAREHLELVFQRFLDAERPFRKVRVAINGRDLAPFDPFNSHHPATTRLREETVGVAGTTIKIQPFVLPHHKKVSAADWKRYAGKAGYLKNQGFYLYRAGRLIIHGTWFRLAKQSELTRLARVRIDMPNGLDDLWKVNVLKASAKPPFVVRERLKKIIDELAGPAHRVYTARGRRLDDRSVAGFWSRRIDKNEIFYEINRDHPVISAYSESLEHEQRGDFASILKAIEQALPFDTLFSDLAGQPQDLNRDPFVEESLPALVETTYRICRKRGDEDQAILKHLEKSEPFCSHWDITSKLLEEVMKEDWE